MIDGVPYIRPRSIGGGYMGPSAAKKLSGWVTISDGKRYPKSILSFSNADQTNRLHPTQKPVALIAYLIRTYTNPGAIILDNCIGSGTTLLAAQNEGRRAVGIEISEEYCKIAVDRLRQPSFFSIPNRHKVEPAKQLEMTI
jgi:site-specific DNA-methyltransferase (adenine-specific)